MLSKFSTKFSIIVVLLLTLSTMLLIKGCNEDQPSQPASDQQDGLALKIFANPETQAKLTGLTVDIVGLNASGQPAIPRLAPITVATSRLPATVPLTLYDPPCRYQVTATAHLTREAPRVVTRVIDICHESRLTLSIDPFEGFLIFENPLRAPESANAGAAIDVACRTNQIDAPDKDRYPLRATLREQDGQTISGPFDVNVAVAGSFPDPYSLNSQPEERRFTCEIADGRSTPQTFTASVRRIPPTPTPQPTSVPPTAIPTNIPMPTITPTGMPTVTPMPTGMPTFTPSPTPTITPTGMPTVTPTPTPTITPTVTPTATPTATPTVTPTPTPYPVRDGQVWSGTYTCTYQGTTPLTLRILTVSPTSPDTLSVRAIFDFGIGSFYMNGEYIISTRQLNLVHDTWIVHPSPYYFVDMTGTISPDGTNYHGDIIAIYGGLGCTTFNLYLTP